MTFKKGDPNINRKGAPEKEWTWGSLIKEMSEFDEGDGKQRKVRIVEALLKKAQEGDTQAFKELANRSDGLPKQDLNVGGDFLIEIVNYANKDKDTI